MKKLIFILSLSFNLFGQLDLSYVKHFDATNGNVFIKDIFVDNVGNIYTTGFFKGSVDFDSDPLVSQVLTVDNSYNTHKVDIFVTKSNSNGDLIWAKSFTSNEYYVDDLWEGYYNINFNDSKSNSIVVDNNGNVYIVGSFVEVNYFNEWTSSIESYSHDGPNIIKLNSNGILLYNNELFPELVSDAMGNPLISHIDSRASKIAFDNDNNLIITGVYNTFSVKLFAIKMNLAGNILWKRTMSTLTSPNNIAPTDISINSQNEILISGIFNGSVDFDPSANDEIISSTGNTTASFILKLNSNGNFEYVKKIESTASIVKVNSLRIDQSDNIVLSGYFNGIVDFDPNQEEYLLNSNTTLSTEASSFILKLSNNGEFIYANSYDNSYIKGMDIDESNTYWFYGKFLESQDFDLSSNEFILNPDYGNSNTFLLNTDSDGDFIFAKNIPGIFDYPGTNFINDPNNTPIVVKNNSIYFGSPFRSTIDFDLTSSELIIENNTTNNFVNIQKYSIDGNCLNNYTTSYLNESICGTSYVSPDNQIYSEPGLYTVIIQNSSGCDSIITINLSFVNSIENSINATSCNSYIYDGQEYLISGNYIHSFTTSSGCDSIVYLNLTILFETYAILSITACDHYTLNGQTYTNSGVYSQTLTNVAGCDSIISLSLEIENLSASAGIIDNMLIASPIIEGNSYQWINCSTGAIIPGATGSEYEVIEDGEYAVIITGNACEETSNCVLYSTVSINNNIESTYLVYPNPTQDLVFISNLNEDSKIYLIDLTGKIIFEGFYNLNGISLSNISKGTYILKIQTLEGSILVNHISIK